jgi:lipopolysaccharide transport system permease protein
LLTTRAYPARPPHSNLRGFFWTVVRTDFKLRYHGSIAGFAWALLRPLSMFVVLQTVFSVMFKSEAAYRLNLLIGLFIWDFFVEATKSGLSSLLGKAHLLTKIRLPARALVVASSANAVFTAAIFLVMIVVSLTIAGRPPSLGQTVLFVIYLAALWAIILGFSLVTSVLFLRYRDLNQFWDLILQVGFFAAPIVYPLGVLPLRYHVFLYLWPPTPIVQFSRSVLVDGVVPSLRAHLLLGAEVGIALAIGFFVFRRYANRVAEYV